MTPACNAGVTAAWPLALPPTSIPHRFFRRQTVGEFMVAVPSLLAFAFLLTPPPADAPALAGTWVLVKGETELPRGVTFVAVFAPDGDLLLRFDTGNPKRDTVHKGKYKLDAGKIDYTISTGAGERSETLTIKSLTADTLVLIDPDGKAEEFRRK